MNIYYILDQAPAIEEEDMIVELEDLAKQLYYSGKFRIDAEEKCNFARFTYVKTGKSYHFTDLELQKDELVADTKAFFRDLLKKDFKQVELEKVVEGEIEKLNKQLSKFQKVSENLGLKLARLIVQSAHPIVIKWLLLEKVEVFISYGNQIGDVMDVATWKHSGSNSGMQSTDGQNVTVYVASGGDPFGREHEEDPTFGDGRAAMARFIVIAGQELGHYADIMRDNAGRQISRHSADFGATRAKDNVKYARIHDISVCDNLLKALQDQGLNSLIEAETNIKFYKKNKVKNLSLLLNLIKISYYKYKIIKKFPNYIFFKKFSNQNYLGHIIKAIVNDMKFNLSPEADVYKKNDKDEEEAIRCIEALARVPQQALKWGHITTIELMPSLYKIYYAQIIPSLIEAYKSAAGELFVRTFAKNSKYKNIFKKLRKIFKRPERSLYDFL